MEQLVNFIIRPPRAEYSPEHDLLDQEFMLKGKWYQRKDIEIKNSREDALKCSHYMPTVCPESKTLPCVIYCHGNSGCRADASEAAIMLLPLNITVFTLDFSGSGLSGGEHVTLGWNEKDDLKAVVDHLRADGNVSMIGLWGRSMGAVTSLMYGAEDPSIAGMVLDSPFSDLVDLMMELVDTYKIRLPKFTVKFAIQYMRRAVQKKAKFDISDLNTIKVAKSCFVPVLIGHAIDDDFIQPHHSERIHDAYMGDKNIIKFDGDHNSPRPQFYFDSISIFFKNVLQPPGDDLGGAVYDSVHMHDYIDKATWTALQGIGFRSSNTSVIAKGTEAGTSTTGDPIEQLRSKRPMSRLEVPADIASQHEVKEDVTSGSPSSSSGMISFELSNGHPCDPNIPPSLDDDQYVEYPLDYSTDFPCDMEDEERMLMMAVMESLKDLEIKPENPDVTDCSGSNSAESTTQKIEPGTSPTHERFVSTGLDTTTDATLSSKMSGNVVNPKSRTSQESSNGPNLNPNSDPLSSDDIAVDTAATGSDHSSSDGTKATLTVEKAPSANIMDGFFRRLDRNFFKK